VGYFDFALPMKPPIAAPITDRANQIHDLFSKAAVAAAVKKIMKNRPQI
jgi:hypothetical protein